MAEKHKTPTPKVLSDKKRKSLPLLFFLPFVLSTLFPAHAQHSFTRLSMAEAVQLAVQNHPDVNNAMLDVEIVKSGKKNLLEFEPTSFTYQHGQLFSTIQDQRLVIEQNFGSPLTPVYKSKMIDAEINLSETRLSLTKKEIEAQTKLLYNHWIYLHHRLNLLDQEKHFYTDLSRIANLHFEMGETSLLEKTTAETLVAEINNRYQQIQNKLTTAENQLRQYIMLDADLIPATEELEIYEINKPVNTDSNRLNISVFRQQEELTKATIRVEQSRYFPEIHAGYFNQQIEGVGGFEGWKAGITVPLWFLPTKQNVEIARLEAAKAKNTYQYQVYRIEKEIDILKDELHRSFGQIQYYKSHALKQADLMIHTVEARYNNESIDYSEYLDGLSRAFDIKRQYIEIIKTYNETAIKLEYYEW